MRSRHILTASGSLALLAAACVFQACGGDDNVNKDGGPDGANPSDSGGGDTGDMDTGAQDTGTQDGAGDTGADSGPTCTSTPCVIGLAVGGHHACALIVDGTVRCWGVNTYGQLGTFDGGPLSTGNRPVPLQVDGLSNVTEVAATTAYWATGATCARTQAGGVLCLGNNSAAQLGLSSTTATPDNNPHAMPTQVAGLPDASSVTLGRYMGCATATGNEYWCWGSNDAFGQTSPGTLGRGGAAGNMVPGKATLVDAGVAVGSAGSYFNLALTTGGDVLSWGDNSIDELGRDTGGNDSADPAPVTGLSNVAQISAGAISSCAISGGDVHCWGDNSYGQLGRGVVGGSSLNATVATGLPGGKKASMVSTSGYHACAVATDGTVYCWGRNNAGQVGPNGMMTGYNAAPVDTAQQVMLPAKALAVGTGGPIIGNGNTSSGYSCALLDGGSVQCWGYNGEGELGRSADAGGTAACASVGNASCSPNPAPVVWQ